MTSKFRLNTILKRIPVKSNVVTTTQFCLCYDAEGNYIMETQ